MQPLEKVVDGQPPGRQSKQRHLNRSDKIFLVNLD